MPVSVRRHLAAGNDYLHATDTDIAARGREFAARDRHGLAAQATRLASRRADPAAAHREIRCLYANKGSAGGQAAGLAALAVDRQVSERINALAAFGRVVHGHHAPVREDQVYVGVFKGQARFIADLALRHVPAAGQGDRGLAAGEGGGDGGLLDVVRVYVFDAFSEARRHGDVEGGHGEGPLVRVAACALRQRDGMGRAVPVDIGHAQAVLKQPPAAVAHGGQGDGACVRQRVRAEYRRAGLDRAVCDALRDQDLIGGQQLFVVDLRQVGNRAP